MLLQIFQLILCLSILIILHELGHFIPAKWFKVKVEKFYLFFNPWFSLVKKKIKETEYGIGWIPLGGYIKISGMIDENLNKEISKQKKQKWEYRSKKNWEKLIIVLGGVTVNFFLSWFIFSIIFTFYGYKYQSTQHYQKNGLSFNQAALNAGFKDGDKITSIDGKPIKSRFNDAKIDILLANEIIIKRGEKKIKIKLLDKHIKSIFNSYKENLISPCLRNIIVDKLVHNSFAEKSGLLKNDTIITVNNKNISSFFNFQKQIIKFANKKITLKIKRNGKLLFLSSNVTSQGTIGLIIKGINPLDYTIVKKLSLFQSIPKAWTHMITILNYQIKQFKLIIRPQNEVYKQTMGPLRMFKIFNPSWNWEIFWNMTAILSIWLAFVNLLPIPGLDGGHAIFIFLEMITGKEISEKNIQFAQKIGFTFIFSIMIFIFGNDIWYWIQESIPYFK